MEPLAHAAVAPAWAVPCLLRLGLRCCCAPRLLLKYIAPLVPAWLPYPAFWTQFAGVALLGAGSTIALGIRRRANASLLRAMVGLWVIGLHLPRVLAAPAPARRGEISSLLEAVAYTATALVIVASSPARRSGR